MVFSFAKSVGPFILLGFLSLGSNLAQAGTLEFVYKTLENGTQVAYGIDPTKVGNDQLHIFNVQKYEFELVRSGLTFETLYVDDVKKNHIPFRGDMAVNFQPAFSTTSANFRVQGQRSWNVVLGQGIVVRVPPNQGEHLEFATIKDGNEKFVIASMKIDNEHSATYLIRVRDNRTAQINNEFIRFTDPPSVWFGKFKIGSDGKKVDLRKFDVNSQEVDSYAGAATPTYSAPSVTERSSVLSKAEIANTSSPGSSSKNLIEDAAMRGRIRGMEEKIAGRIYGQEIAVKKLTDAVKARVANQGSKTAASVLLLGTTGTGKTEMAKELAEVRYGSSDAIGRIDMGEVKSLEDTWNIFGAARGHVNSGTPGKLEAIFKKHPNGAVILLDEISNCGGRKEGDRKAIMQMFYPFLDEPSWTAAVSEQTYDLTKYTFIFTGNELEEHFQAVRADDLLDQIYRDLVANPDEVEATLVRNGFPEAFIGRMKATVLMKPPSRKVKVAIAKKLMEDWVRNFSHGQPFDVEFEKGFEEELADLIFTPRKGGRSIRNFLDTSLGSLAADAIFEMDWERLQKDRGKVKVWIESVKPEMPFFKATPDLKKAILHIRSEQGGKVVFDGALDFTRDAKFITQIRKIDAWGTAFHEAGHAILNDPRFSGQKLAMVTIVPNGNYLGYARYEDLPGARTNINRESLVKDIAILLGGTEAEGLMGRLRNTGVGGDMSDIRTKLQKTILEAGLLPEVAGARVGEDGKIILSAKIAADYENYVAAVLKDATELARRELTKKWTWVTLVAKELMKKGSISGDRVAELRSQAIADKGHYTVEKIKAIYGRMSVHCDLLLEEEW